MLHVSTVLIGCMLILVASKNITCLEKLSFTLTLNRPSLALVIDSIPVSFVLIINSAQCTEYVYVC